MTAVRMGTLHPWRVGASIDGAAQRESSYGVARDLRVLEKLVAKLRARGAHCATAKSMSISKFGSCLYSNWCPPAQARVHGYSGICDMMGASVFPNDPEWLRR